MTCLQPCTFKVDYTLPTAPGLEFGSVFLADGTENLALSVAAAGWAKVRAPGRPLAPVGHSHVSPALYFSGCFGR